MTNKVVLYYPPYDGPPLGPPLCLLSLASPLIAAGFQVKIVDSAITASPEGTVAREIKDALCFGVSFLTGPMIENAIHISRLVRSLRPDIPIIFGGWHATILPAQTLAAGIADIVVRGQGELTLLEVAERLRDGKGLEEVRGCTVKTKGEAIHNPDRPVANLNNLPTPLFSMGDYDAYEQRSGVRKVTYASSVGCPYACNYCTDLVYYGQRFNAYKAERVVSEVTDLVSRWRLSEVAFLDSNFPVDVKRALAIARGFVDSGVKFHWSFQASTNLLCRMSDDEVCLLGESGVHHMGFGTESASPEVLILMNKKHQRIDEMFETARKTERAGIRVTFNLILGFLGETESDRVQTLRVMTEIARKYPNVSFSPNLFTPYPGISVWPELRKNGVREPRSLEEWSRVTLGGNQLPWLAGRSSEKLSRMVHYFMLCTETQRQASRDAWLGRRIRKVLAAPLRWRLRAGQYSFPWELWLARGLSRVAARRSLLNGQVLRRGMQEAC
ncbi:MAG TPA: radical SAM protein [Terriglobia bacterium]|nr:radical SAM protein [Terriglobia bacterium]